MSVLSARIGDFTLRAATLDDADFTSDLRTAINPDEPWDPKIFRYQWENHPPEMFFERLIVEHDGGPVGAVGHAHMPWGKMPQRYGWVWADVLPELRSAERLWPLWELVEDRSGAEGTKVFSAWTWERDTWGIGFLESRGYKEERRARGWELDLAPAHERLLGMAEKARERMRAEDIRCLTLAADGDPAKYEKLWRCFEESVQDMPTTVPHVPEPLEWFMKWLRRPGLREDRIWIARLEDDVVGVSVLQYPPVRGHVNTAWTGTKRKVRGRGVARALKLETIAQAIALGVPRIRTGNDSTNAPILHLNEELGYRSIPGAVQHLKEA